MPTFFEKLKKGMEAEDLPATEDSPPAEEVLEDKKKKKVKKTKKSEKETKTSKKVEELKKKIIKVKEERKELEPTRQSFAPEILDRPEGQLVVDIYQTDKEIVIQSAIAGVKPENLDISIENDMVIIRGVREEPFEQEERNYFYQECYWGPFSREVILPEEVDNSRIQASVKQGVLIIRIPKIGRRKRRKVTVKE